MTPESDPRDPLATAIYDEWADLYRRTDGLIGTTWLAVIAADVCRRQHAAELRAEQAELARLGCVRAALAMGEAAAIVAGDRRHP